MATTNFNLRLEQDLRDKAFPVFERYGLSASQAFKLFLTQVAETNKIPVVIVSTKDQETDRVWGRRQGASDYLTKPIDEAALMKVITQLLAAG